MEGQAHGARLATGSPRYSTARVLPHALLLHVFVCVFVFVTCSYLKCVRITATDGFPGVLSYERHQGFLSYQQEYEVSD